MPTLLTELKKVSTLSHPTPSKALPPDVISYLFCNVYYDSRAVYVLKIHWSVYL